jgi:hypothetical protein
MFDALKTFASPMMQERFSFPPPIVAPLVVVVIGTSVAPDDVVAVAAPLDVVAVVLSLQPPALIHEPPVHDANTSAFPEQPIVELHHSQLKASSVICVHALQSIFSPLQAKTTETHPIINNNVNEFILS